MVPPEKDPPLLHRRPGLLNPGRIAAIGALSMTLGIALGAFGAHGLKDVVSPYQLQVYEKGVFYQLVNALGLLGIGALAQAKLLPTKSSVRVAGLLILGTIIFSGSLYGIGLTGERWLGAITPIGGLSFIVGWAVVAAELFRQVPSADAK